MFEIWLNTTKKNLIPWVGNCVVARKLQSIILKLCIYESRSHTKNQHGGTCHEVTKGIKS